MKRAILLICLLTVYAAIFYVAAPIVGQVWSKRAGLPIWIPMLAAAMTIVYFLSFTARTYFAIVVKENEIKTQALNLSVIMAMFFSAYQSL
jgi:hypothetical protein